MIILRYFSGRAYQGDRSSMPFQGSGPTTAGGNVYAGHWMYLAGTTTTETMTSDVMTVHVADAGRIVAGQYAVVYDSLPGRFVNAEHVKVVSVDESATLVMFETRGYKSSATIHPAGSIIATHAVGAGGLGTPPPPENWGYNQSVLCPEDANGKQLSAVMADWLAVNLNVDPRTGDQLDVFDGLLLDGDVHSLVADSLPYDADDDLTADQGVVGGTNVWGVGLEALYAGLRAGLTPRLVVGGASTSRGFATLNGTQMEGFPNNALVRHDRLDQKLAAYSDHLHHGEIGPLYTEAFNKSPTLLYPGGADATSNAPFRLAFGMALLEDGYFGTKFGDWWDEFAVDVIPGSPTYGYAIEEDPLDESRIREHRLWLGWPLGARTRIYDPKEFRPSVSLVENGGFENGISGWTSTNVLLSHETRQRNVFRGTGSLHVSKQLVPDPYGSTSSVMGPPVTLIAGAEYTVCFAAKSSKTREIPVLLGANLQTFLTRPRWSRRVMTFKAEASGDYPLTFLVGAENSDLWLDSIFVFAANADVFRRDFDHGTVVVNATSRTRTIDLGGTFQRIFGRQDPINDGGVLTDVTLASHDTAILVRPSP
jgi:hypothetical protein